MILEMRIRIGMETRWDLRKRKMIESVLIDDWNILKIEFIKTKSGGNKRVDEREYSKDRERLLVVGVLMITRIVMGEVVEQAGGIAGQ